VSIRRIYRGKNGRTYEQGKNESPDWEIGVPNFNRNNTEDEHRQEDGGVPPLRNLGVLGHQTSMDIRLLTHRTPRLDPNLLAEVQKRMSESGSDRGKRQAVSYSKGGGQEEGAVSLVCCQVERRIWIDDGRDVVTSAGIVKGSS
jgi:hypothetical protein